MAETMVEALSGTEIVEDVLAQIRRKLMGSCDLRDSDSYGGGYSAEITIKMKMYSMDVRQEEFVVAIPAKELPPVTTEEVIVTPFDVNETLEIAQEEDLEIVRERTKEPALEPEAVPEEEARMPARLKRKYTRRNTLETTPMGGAVDLDSLPEGE